MLERTQLLSLWPGKQQKTGRKMYKEKKHGKGQEHVEAKENKRL
jgi:hypothetical protein